MRTRLVGWKFAKDTLDRLYPKDRQVLELLKQSSRPLSSLEIAERMGYRNPRASLKAAHVVLYRLKGKGLVKSVTKQVEGLVSREMRLFAESSKAVKDWMRRLKSDQTKQKWLHLFLRYFQWIREKDFFKTPDKMLDHKQNAVNDKDRYYHVNLVEDYLAESGLSVQQQKGTYSAVRSFYKHNKAALPSYTLTFQDESFVVNVQEPITLDEIKTVLTNAEPREKATFLIMLQGGLDRSTFCEVFNFQAWPQITKQLGSEDPDLWDLSRAPIRIDLVRVKTRNKYYTFLSRDALEGLKAWLKVRESLTGEKMRNGEPLFITIRRTALREDSLSNVFRKLAIRAGLEVKKYGKPNEVHYKFHAHELRDTFRTACTVAGVNYAAAEFFIGHSIDKLKYDKSPEVHPEHFREQYKKVEPHVNLFSSQSVYEKKIEDLEQQLIEKDQELEQLKTAFEIEKQSGMGLEKRIAELEDGMRRIYEIDKRDEAIIAKVLALVESKIKKLEQSKTL